MNRIVPNNTTAGLNFVASIEPCAVRDGWEYLLFLRGPVAVDMIATAGDGGAQVFEIPAATTAAWPAGPYAYTLRATNGADTYEVESGILNVLADITALPAGYDPRSEWVKGLEAIDAVIARRATLDQERYRINNRELYRTPIADLLKLRGYYAEKVRKEQCKGSGWREVRVGFAPMRGSRGWC